MGISTKRKLQEQIAASAQRVQHLKRQLRFQQETEITVGLYGRETQYLASHTAMELSSERLNLNRLIDQDIDSDESI